MALSSHVHKSFCTNCLLLYFETLVGPIIENKFTRMHACNFLCPLFSNGRDGSRQWKTDVHECHHQGDFVSQRYIYLLCSDHRHLSNSLDIYGSDLASAEKSVKKWTQFFSYCKMGTRSSKFVFYGQSTASFSVYLQYK